MQSFMLDLFEIVKLDRLGDLFIISGLKEKALL